MVMNKLLLTGAICLLLVGFGHASQPAIRARLTKNGVDYLATAGQQVLGDLVKQQATKLPSFESSSMGATLRLNEGGVIEEFQAPDLQMIPSPPNVFSVLSYGGELQLNANGSAEYSLGYFNPGFDFELHAMAKGLNVNVSVKLEVTDDGHLQLEVLDCASDITDLDLQFEGGYVTSVVNLFQGTMKSTIVESLCGQVESLINDTANVELKRLRQHFDLIDGFGLNYEFAVAPQLTAQVADVLFGGSIQFGAENPISVIAPPLPITDEHEKFVYLWVAAADIANAFAKLGQQKGVLKYKLDGKSQPGAAKFLRTSCFGFCIGTLWPKLRKAHPRTSVYLDLNTDEPPTFELTEGKASLHLNGGMVIRTEKPIGARVISGRLSVDGSVTVELKTDNPEMLRLHGHFNLERVKLRNFTSDVGQATNKQLQRLLNVVSPWLAAAISFRLNTLALPKIPALQLIEPEIRLMPGFIEIASSINYTGTIPLPDIGGMK